jgi:hypothetical protein
MSNKTLKPCPCGTEAVIRKLSTGDWSVSCVDPCCDWSVTEYTTRDAAIASWNRRASPAPVASVPVERPCGWQWTHERDTELLARDGLMCEAHPGTVWPHGACAGPAMPWKIEGREKIIRLLHRRPAPSTPAMTVEQIRAEVTRTRKALAELIEAMAKAHEDLDDVCNYDAIRDITPIQNAMNAAIAAARREIETCG